MAEGNGTLSIGAFSMITRLSQKALRFYEEKGLLRPARKDITGYRWYSFEQVPQGLLLRRLSDLGFSVEDMNEVLEAKEAGPDRERLEAVIRRRRLEIASQVADLEAIRGLLENGKTLEVLDVKNEEPMLKDVPAMRVVSKVGKGTYAAVTPRLIGELMGLVMGPGNRQARVSGPPMAIYHDEEYKEQDAIIEVAVPVTGRLEVDEGFEVKTLPPAKVMSALHKGPFNRVGETWGRLFKHVSDKGLRPSGKARELYLSDPARTPESELLTEVQVPVVQ